ncbi:MAG: nitrile hydratase subunit beta, partial [Candidatus Rokubacteria bacterium]|nr:nitrile hydratase subunit beta [Candidatus Rokubacteria bacterium]
MNGVHDMGGMHGMGPIEHEENEPAFHHEWERRAFALTMAAGYLGRWNIDMSRFSREDMPAARYLAASYYERWIWGLESLLEAAGLVRREETSARVRGERRPVPPLPAAAGRVLKAAAVDRVLRSARDARVDA